MEKFTGNLEGEIWKEIPGSDGFYQVSTKGRVNSYNNNGVASRDGWNESLRYRKIPKLKNQQINNKGYFMVCLRVYGKYKTLSVHRLMALTFLENPNNYAYINHIDGNKLNNNIENLEWVSPRENIAHRVKSQKGKYSNYPGVSKDKRDGAWWAQINLPGENKNKNLGRFKTELEAAQAYQNAMKEYGIINKYATICEQP